MQVKNLLVTAALVVTAFVWNAQPAAASVFTLEDLLSGDQGTSVDFSGSLTHEPAIDPSLLYLNGVSLTLSSPGLTGDESPFFTNFPPLLTGGETSGPAVMFSVAIDMGLVPGVYFGSFSLFGGESPTADGELGAQDFRLVVGASSVPEPASLGLVAAGLAVLAARARRKKALREDFCTEGTPAEGSALEARRGSRLK